MKTSRRFYVYIYRDTRPGKNMQPIYVGKGSGKRAYEHLFYGYQHNELFERKLAKMRAAGVQPDVTVINVKDESVAFDIECGLIAIYGRINKKTGTLCNLTDGGEGFAGGIHTESHKEKISAVLKGRFRSDEHRKNLAVALTGNKHKPETIEKIRKNSKEKASSAEFRKALSEALKGRKLSPEVAAQRADFLRKLNQSPERRAQISEQMKARHAARRADKLKGNDHDHD